MSKFCVFTVALGFAIISTSCGGGIASVSANHSGTGPGNPSPIYVTAEDAPLGSVLSFVVTIDSIKLTSSNGTVNLLSTPTTVDFGRLVGLRSLLEFNQVPADTYTSATFALSSPIITYVSTGISSSVATITGTLSSSTVTATFPEPLVVLETGLAGLHVDFDLRDSLALDLAGQITGVVNPILSVNGNWSVDESTISDLTGIVVSINTQGNSFVMLRPNGLQQKILVNLQTLLGPITEFNGSWTLSTLPVGAAVSIVGQLAPDGSLYAAAVEVITTGTAFISGRVLQVNPSSGPAQTVTVYIEDQMPAMTGNFALGRVVTLDASTVQTYDVSFIDNWAQFAYDDSSIVAGQRIFVGGAWNGSTQTFAPDLVSLRRQGVVGTLVLNSVTDVSGNQGSFLLQNGDLLGWATQGPFTVNTVNTDTTFSNVSGLSALQSAGTASIVAGGLVLKNPSSGLPEVYAAKVAVLP